jgi:1-acyl-sn-glycerol-3-phosphate acyltransferase
VAERVFRSLLVPRSDDATLGGRAILAPLLDQLDRGGSLILFPEGTRGNGKEVADFKGGLYHLCHERPDVEAVPVYLGNLHSVLPKGRVIPMPRGSSVTFGRPLRLSGREGNREFLARAREALLELKGR